MRALVVYESMFGNTQTVATAIAEGLRAAVTVDLVEVGAAPTTVDDDIGLLVVGGPTHAFGMSRAATRRDAAEQAEREVVSAGTGLREWLEVVQAPAARIPAAAFGTLIDNPWVPGSAARAAEKRLRKLGFAIVAPAEAFIVGGVPGPLADGEVDRARQWGAMLGARLSTAGVAP